MEATDSYRFDEIAGVRILECLPVGKIIQTDRDAVDLIGEALHHGAPLVIVPAARLAPEFFRLRSRVAGEIVQKFVQYRRRLVVLGDLSPYLAESSAFSAFVAEANRGADLWFLSDRAALEQRLARNEAFRDE